MCVKLKIREKPFCVEMQPTKDMKYPIRFVYLDERSGMI
jgi:hypothetical protein